MIIGYTTGVFDLFHIGHLNIIKQSREKCDLLVVGVTTDELSLEIKKKRPIIPFEERLEIVKSLKYVDEAVAQTSMNKFDAWQQIKFNRMFVGGDWKGHPKWNKMEDEFKKYSVEIIYFPYTTHTSSTILKEKVLNY